MILLLIAVVSGFWGYTRFKKKLSASFVPVIILNLAILPVWAVILGVTADESVHLHLSWLVSQGMIPYKDFWQHHPPFLWVVLSPLMASIKPSVDVFSVVRFLSGIVFVLNLVLGWSIARQVWGGKARLSVYLLILSSISLAAEVVLIKPDIFMTFFLLSGIGVSLEIPGKRVFPSFLAGLAFSLAASFMVKQYLLLLLPVVAIFLGEKRAIPSKLALYVSGFLAGLIPLLSYLVGHDIFQDYIFWVLSFNSKIVVLSVSFPLGIAVLAGWGGYLLLKRSEDIRDAGSLLLFIALLLSTLSSLTTTSAVGGPVYLAAWFFISAIVASGCDLSGAFDMIPCLFKRSAVYGLVFCLFLSFSMERLWQCTDPRYNTDKGAVAQLMKYCAHDTCIAFSPTHPVFSYDTTRLYSAWQYSFAGRFLFVREDIARVPVVERIRTLRPALIPYRFLKRDFILDLAQKGLISAGDYKRIVPFLDENYTRERIGVEDYYVRNDKLRKD